MRIRSVLVGLLIVVGQVVIPASLPAQHVGFQTAGIPQHRAVSTPVHGQGAHGQVTHSLVVPVRSTFNAPFPAVPTIVVPAPGIGQIPLIPNFPTAIVPNPALNPFLLPSQTMFVPSVPLVQPVQPFTLFPGMPRADLLRHYGQPSVTVITSTGETLYFTGGVTVILQNGLVVSTR